MICEETADCVKNDLTRRDRFKMFALKVIYLAVSDTHCLFFLLIIFVYLSLLLVAHLSNAARRRLVVMGDSGRIQDETTENSTWVSNVLSV